MNGIAVHKKPQNLTVIVVKTPQKVCYLAMNATEHATST